MAGWQRWWVGACALALSCGAPLERGSPRPSSLTVLHTADLHSHLWPFRSRVSALDATHGLGRAGALAEVGGLARLATLLARERATTPHVWIDSGDALEGTSVFHRYGGRPELELLGRLGLSAMALGNHELSSEVGALAELFQGAPFPVLSANLTPREDSPLFGRLAPSARLLVDGVRLGVVGVSSPTSPPGLASRNAWSLELAADASRAVQWEVDQLADSVDLVVVLSHLGLDGDRELVRRTTGVDLVLGGHQHIVTFEPEWAESCGVPELRVARGCDARPVAIVHSGAYGKWLSRLELTLVPSLEPPGTLDVATLSLEQLAVASEVPAQPELEAELADLRAPAEPPLAYCATALKRTSPLGGDSSLGNFVADAMRDALGVEAIVLNTSALRADVDAGPVLRSDLELAFPFAEPWRLVWISGSELLGGLSRAAKRSAQRNCVSTVQVAGLTLRIDCASCAADASGCVFVERGGGLGVHSAEWLLVGLPSYLTLPGGDFFELLERGEEVAVDVSEAMVARLRGSARLSDAASCAKALGGWSPSRCQEAFGGLGCSFDAATAQRICAELPAVSGGRDGRIAMLPG